MERGKGTQLDTSLIYSIKAVWLGLSSGWFCVFVFYELRDGYPVERRWVGEIPLHCVRSNEVRQPTAEFSQSPKKKYTL